MEQRLEIKNWKLKNLTDGQTFDAHVPGDITNDLFAAGLITDPYFGINFKRLGWVADREFEYTGTFTMPADGFGYGDISLLADGIDTFADIFVNDVPVCSTENMFLAYAPSIKHVVHIGENTVRVRMHSTTQKMKTIDTEGYFGVFNIPRLFVRKAQCHFGWDWAPDLCGYGIWRPMTVACRHKHRIESVNYHAFNDGDVTLFAELNYCINATTDNYGVSIEGTAEEKIGDLLTYRIYAPDGKLAAEEKLPVEGKKNFGNLHVDAPQLWWPSGYGKQPLYRYEITLTRDGRDVSQASGNFAFREIELIQKPTGADTLGFKLRINGRDVFVRGSNWVPIDCFTGSIPAEKYRKLIRLAKNANLNMLRVWGGGVYENDLFYELCDREGLMIWQDFMFACGDIPEDNPAWVENTLKECEYQVKRLRTHPSIVYWCGGNEKTGSYALQISRGDKFVDYTLQGLVKTFDRTRPYVRQSPFSFSDVGNNCKSGETHCNSFEPSLTKGIVNYRDTMNETETSFYSECAVMGPNSLETFKKFMPQEKYWPMNECWDERLCDNPYAAILMTFAKRQALYVRDMYGEAGSLEEFTAKAMLIHREMLCAECDYARSKHEKTGGFINWMFSDIWPTGTWSVVDYYTEPKQAYYGIKKAYAPLRVCFVQDKQKKQQLILINDTLEAQAYDLQYSEKTMDGKCLWTEKATGEVKPGTALTIPVAHDCVDFGTYLSAAGSFGAEPVHTLYSVNFWRKVSFESDYTWTAEKLSDTCIKVHIKANKFTKSVFISLPDNYKYIYSDNYLDLEAGQEATVTVTAEEAIDETKLTLCDYASMQDKEATE